MRRWFIVLFAVFLTVSLLWAKPWRDSGVRSWVGVVLTNILAGMVLLAADRWILPAVDRRRRERPPGGARPLAASTSQSPVVRQARAARPTGELWRRQGERQGQRETGPDWAPMRWVTGGRWFVMGSHAGKADERPPHEVFLTRGFWIHECLVSSARYARYLNDKTEGGVDMSRDPVVICALSEITSADGRYVAQPGRGEYPVIGADWRAAAEYARHYGLSLPTEAQWEYAARGCDGRPYPWGKRWNPQKCCNDDNQGPPYSPPGDPAEDTRTMPVGSLPEGASPCEALHMVGNLMEWCQDWYDRYPEDARKLVDPVGPPSSPEGKRVVRGGNCWYGRVCCNTTNREHSSEPHKAWGNSVGFRCVYQDPDWPALTVPEGTVEHGDQEGRQ